MKIAVIGTKGLPAKQGGIERYCEELYVKVVAQGHSVDLFARSSYVEKPWFYSYKYKGVNVICLPSLPFKGLDATVGSALGAVASILKSYDVVHFHALGPALFTWLPALFSSAKILVTCQGLDWQRAKWGKLASQMIYWGERMAVKFAHSIVVVSEDLKDYFWKNYQINTVYIPNGPAEYAASDSQFNYVKSLGLEPGRYLLFLGRLVPEKRPELLIEAFKTVEKTGWKLLLAGGSSDTAEYTELLNNLAASDRRVLFAGEVQGSRLAEIVRGAGFFVLPSDLEGLPLVMLEAMREGVPVIASDIAPHRQLIGNERGTLFRAGDRQSLIETLKSALDRPLEVAQMALKAKEYVNTNFTWEKITESNLNLYKKILKMRKNSKKFGNDLDLSGSKEALREDGKSEQVCLSNSNRVIQKWK
jgi:glycosyltransferase involved in cell wall biosynthesis